MTRPKVCVRATIEARSTGRQYIPIVKNNGSSAGQRGNFQEALNDAGYGQITSELSMAGEFYYAEHYHHHLAKVPNGYCGLGGPG